MSVFLNTTRDGYGPDQCTYTMTVGELVDALSNFDSESLIYFKNDNGYTYGNISNSLLEEEYEDDNQNDLGED